MIADVRRLVQLALDLWERSEPKAPAQTPVAGLERVEQTSSMVPPANAAPAATMPHRQKCCL